MDITQSFYDGMASQYDKLFLDWQATTHEQAVILNRIFNDSGFDISARILDCACGIGTQTIGLALLGYSVTASDISDGWASVTSGVVCGLMGWFVTRRGIIIICRQTTPEVDSQRSIRRRKM